jgi:hypothetical protein
MKTATRRQGVQPCELDQDKDMFERHHQRNSDAVEDAEHTEKRDD